MSPLPCQGLDSSTTDMDKKDKERQSRALRKELKKVRLDIHIIQQKAQELEKRKDYLLEELRKTSGVLRPSQESMPGCGDELLGRLFTQEEEIQEVESQEEKEGEEEALRIERTQPFEAEECDCRHGRGVVGGGHIWRAQLDDSLSLENHSILVPVTHTHTHTYISLWLCHCPYTTVVAPIPDFTITSTRAPMPPRSEPSYSGFIEGY